MKKIPQNLVLALIAIILFYGTFNLAITGQNTATCPDWSFHLCYSRQLALESCTSAYDSYANVVHTLAFNAQRFNLSVEAFLAGLFGIMVVVTALTLFKHGKTLGILSYFIVIPAFLIFIAQKAPYLWFSMVYCGLIPYFTAVTLAFYALCELDLENRKRDVCLALLALLTVLWIHNYGLLIALFVLTTRILIGFLFRNSTPEKRLEYAMLVTVIGSLFAGWSGLFGDMATRFLVFTYLALSVLAGVWVRRLTKK